MKFPGGGNRRPGHTGFGRLPGGVYVPPVGLTIEQRSSATSSPFLWRVLDNANQVEGYLWFVEVAPTLLILLAGAGTGYSSKRQEITLGDINGTGDIAFTGLQIPASGSLFLRLTVQKDDGAGGYTTVQVSNILTDTLVASSLAELTAATGLGKSQYIDTTGTPKKLSAAMNNVIGAVCGVGATTNTTGAFHCEWTVISLGTLLQFGIRDASFALGPAVFNPSCGNGVKAGVSLGFDTSTSLVINVNGSATGGSTPVLALGDVISLDGSTTAHTARFTHRRSGVETLLANLTLTTNIPADWNAYGGGASNAGGGDSFSFNPGNTAFAVTPQSGHGIYG